MFYRLSTITRWQIIASLAVALSACNGLEKNDNDIQIARYQLSRGDLSAAQLSVNKTLAGDPNSADAYFILAQIQERQRSFQQALDHYRKALELNKDHFEARLKLGQIFLAAGDTDKASDMARYVLQFRPSSLEAKTLVAAILARKGDNAAATIEAEKILQAKPGYPEATLLLAGLFMKAGQTEQADALINKALDTHPQHPALLEAAVNVAVTNYNSTRIVDLFQRLIKIEPYVFAHRVNLAGFYHQRAQFQDAEAVLTKAVTDDNKDPQRKVTLVRFLLGQNEIKRAEDYLTSWLKTSPNNTDLLFELAGIYDLTQNYDLAIQTYRKLIMFSKDNEKSKAAKIKFVDALLRSRNLVDASQVVNELAKQFPKDMEVILLHAKVALAKREIETAIADLRAVVASQPNAIEAMDLLIRAYIENGQARLAEDGLQRALSVAPNNGVLRWQSIHLYLAQNKIDAALQANEEFLKIEPNHLDSLKLRAELLRKSGDQSGADDAIEKLIAAYPDQAIGYFLAGQQYFDKKKFPEAVEEFDRAINRAPDDPQILEALIKTVLARGNYEEAISRLQSRLNSRPNDSIAFNALGEVLLQKNEVDSATEAFKNSISNNPLWSEPYLNLTKLYIKENKFTAAIELYKAGLARMPSIEMELGLADALQHAGKDDEAIKEFETILVKYPGNTPAMQKYSDLLLRYKQVPSHAQRLKELADEFEESQDANLLATAGWIYYQFEDYDRALPVMQKALDKTTDLGLIHYRLALVYLRKGLRVQAKRHLNIALNQEFSAKKDARDLAAKL